MVDQNKERAPKDLRVGLTWKSRAVQWIVKQDYV